MSTHPENFSHDIKAETVRVLHMPRGRRAEVHKDGCQHAAKATHVFDAQPGAELTDRTVNVYSDDYFHVAPCARRA